MLITLEPCRPLVPLEPKRKVFRLAQVTQVLLLCSNLKLPSWNIQQSSYDIVYKTVYKLFIW